MGLSRHWTAGCLCLSSLHMLDHVDFYTHIKIDDGAKLIRLYAVKVSSRTTTGMCLNAALFALLAAGCTYTGILKYKQPIMLSLSILITCDHKMDSKVRQNGHSDRDVLRCRRPTASQLTLIVVSKREQLVAGAQDNAV